MRDMAGAVPTKARWTPEEDSRLREAMRGLDPSTRSYTAVSKQFPSRSLKVIRDHWRRLRDLDGGAFEVGGTTRAPLHGVREEPWHATNKNY